MIEIAVAIFEMVTLTLPPAVVHRPYSPPPLSTLGGGWCPQNQVRHRVSAGELPPGLTLSPAGQFEGTAQETGVYVFTVRSENDCSVYHRRMAIEVRGAPLLQVNKDEVYLDPLSPQTLLVSSSWRDLAYSIELQGAPWLLVEPERGFTPPSGSPLTGDPVTLTADASKLTPGTYSARMRIVAWEAANQPSVKVTLVVP